MRKLLVLLALAMVLLAACGTPEYVYLHAQPGYDVVMLSDKVPQFLPSTFVPDGVRCTVFDVTTASWGAGEEHTYYKVVCPFQNIGWVYKEWTSRYSW